MRKIILLLIILVTGLAHAQDKKHYYSFALSNSHTARPFASFSKLFYKDFHPGLELGYGTVLNSVKKHQWAAEIGLGYLFHRWVQHNIFFSANGGYRRDINSSWSAGAKLGGAYQLSIPTGKVYTITEEGLKEKTALRSQFLGSLGFSIDKKISSSGSRLFLEYQQKIQTPFINEYVPLLPYNSILMGVKLPVQ